MAFEGEFRAISVQRVEGQKPASRATFPTLAGGPHPHRFPSKADCETTGSEDSPTTLATEQKGDRPTALDDCLVTEKNPEGTEARGKQETKRVERGPRP